MSLDTIKSVIERLDPPWRANELLSRDLPLVQPRRISPNGHCRMVAAQDGWLAVNLARDDDWNAVPAWLQAEAKDWEAIEAIIAQRSCAALIDQAILLGLPVSQLGETKAAPSCSALPLSGQWATGVRVLDISALWAGPLCGGILAEAGAQVTKVQSITRPDPTPIATPLLDAQINGRKTRLAMDFADQAALADLVRETDILITSARPHALARLGLSEDAILAANPKLIWIAITAHGWHGDEGARVGFGDDCAAAGGLVGWSHGAPSFIGDALADPLTGLMAASLARDALEAGSGGVIDISLAGSARWFAQEAGL